MPARWLTMLLFILAGKSNQSLQIPRLDLSVCIKKTHFNAESFYNADVPTTMGTTIRHALIAGSVLPPKRVFPGSLIVSTAQTRLR